ncbi:hypothetical protein EXIGLDRAFT_846244 [Exidia glandulosa HHB12029]|uniref:Uncharacterized protein n=1 Tax=Exidia glandulosa HHB12029 TaxID=1314781 RepID=A0A165B3J7_EXIGL|nr:hypothetical protein EXIGLDRAFT_846244 [Exidia glandulosa HHB12029]
MLEAYTSLANSALVLDAALVAASDARTLARTVLSSPCSWLAGYYFCRRFSCEAAGLPVVLTVHAAAAAVASCTPPAHTRAYARARSR